MTEGPIASVNLAKYFIAEKAVDDILLQYQLDYSRHYGMLRNLASSLVDRTPILYIRNLPFVEPSPGTSQIMREAADERYRAIDKELDTLAEIDPHEESLEAGAISTARAVVKQLSSRQLAPPELARLGNDAIVMLWAIGTTKYAITVTDGEVGYVVRQARETLQRKTNISAAAFDILLIK